MFKKHRTRHRNRHQPSQSLAEDDVIAFLDKYFDDFEHNLRDNNFDKMNTSLVQNVISKFGKIFHLWDQNRILQQSMDKKDIEDIYQSMHLVLGTDQIRNYDPIDTNDFILECNHCGETFPLRNNDCRYSYHAHSLSKQHLEFMNNLNLSDSADSASSAESESADSDVDYVDGYEQLFIYARCNLCYNRITFGDLNYKEDEAVVVKAIMTHLEAPSHRRNVNVFRDNKRYVDEVDLKNNIYKCTLCDQNLFMDKIIEHFQSIEHRNRIILAIPGNSTIAADSKEEDYIPMLQPRLHIYQNFRQNPPEDQGVYVQLANLCIDQPKLTIVSEPKAPTNNTTSKKKKKKNKPKKGATPLTPESDSISVFDANCLIVKNNYIRCKMCLSILKAKWMFTSHLTGKEHLKNIKLYESSCGDFVKQTDDLLECTLCAYNSTKFKIFLAHCQSSAHLERIKQSAFQPSTIIDRADAKVIRCPVVECTSRVSSLSQLFEHVKIHGIIVT